MFALTALTLRSRPGVLDFASITGTGAFREFAKLLKKDNDAPAERALTTGFHNLGLIVDAPQPKA
ncbi:MAG: hypothetical protein HKN27_14675 [Silicimonas sp.]|nr:hypothetical protein [Silicimonas sp.]